MAIVSSMLGGSGGTRIPGHDHRSTNGAHPKSALHVTEFSSVALCINGTADRAGACHGDCLATAEPMTPMFSGYRSDRHPACQIPRTHLHRCRTSVSAHAANPLSKSRN